MTQALTTERVIALFITAIVVLSLILYVLWLIGKEIMRQVDIWVVHRARYLEQVAPIVRKQEKKKVFKGTARKRHDDSSSSSDDDSNSASY